MKSISTINPAITENTESLIVKARNPVIDRKMGVPWFITTLHFQLLRILWVTFFKVRSASASTVHLYFH